MEYILFLGFKFSWKEGIDTCFNVECALLLLGCNFDFCGIIYGGYTAHYLVFTADYCLLLSGYWWLLLVTGEYYLLLLVPTFSMNGKILNTNKLECFVLVEVISLYNLRGEYRLFLRSVTAFGCTKMGAQILIDQLKI